MQVAFVTRYSYFGFSGWRSASSKEIDALLDPKRLEQRAHYFQNITLPSLAAQTDPKFKLVVMSSEAMPEPQKQQLQSICHDVLGDRAHVFFRRPGHAGTGMQSFVKHHLKGPAFTAQVVLDDDDAVSTDFVAAVRAESQALIPLLKSGRTGYDYTYLSYPEGISAEFRGGGLKFSTRNVAFTNLGLTLLARTNTPRSPYSIDHANVARDHPTRVIYQKRPYYVRSVHDFNDSVGYTGKDIIPEEQYDERVFERFPFLRAVHAQYK
ncbi:MAG: glycosyltransferase [Sulfitobacter sp.]